MPYYAGTDPAEFREQALEECRRELWLPEVRHGDMLRVNIPLPTGVTPAGQVIIGTTPWCYLTREEQKLRNPDTS